MAATAKSRATRRYNEKSYDRVSVMLPRGRKKGLESFAADSPHKSINGLINALLAAAMGFTLDEWKRPGSGPGGGNEEQQSQPDA